MGKKLSVSNSISFPAKIFWVPVKASPSSVSCVFCTTISGYKKAGRKNETEEIDCETLIGMKVRQLKIYPEVSLSVLFTRFDYGVLFQELFTWYCLVSVEFKIILIHSHERTLASVIIDLMFPPINLHQKYNTKSHKRFLILGNNVLSFFD